MVNLTELRRKMDTRTRSQTGSFMLDVEVATAVVTLIDNIQDLQRQVDVLRKEPPRAA